jgi:Sulfotransferase domain
MGWFKTFPLTNIYHCTVHKAGSQWVAGLLSDETIRHKTGMKIFTYQKLLPGGFDPRQITDRHFYLPFPENRIITPLYISYDCYKSIIKPQSYKSLYIYRDPRDILVSYYHSVKKSHPLMGDIESIRQQLQGMNQEEGLIRCIKILNDQGLWQSMHSWTLANDEKLLLIKYENLIGENYLRQFEEMLHHLEITLSQSSLTRLVNRYKFESISGRKAGIETDSKHMRKGIAGDWQNYFTPAVELVFAEESRGLQT